uniref:riboflavin kinase n=1 Tax=Globisporangium ultimum (strain ATCC 200006 / CBS 805.95 / DAOM BR144) TaxID=431595 RepID=K3WZB1_GLOUD
MSVEALNEPIRLEATVVEGFGRGGKQLGCPTANLSREDLGDQLEKLPTGIYCGWATVDGKGPFKAVASIGWNPYFKNKEKTVEPHLLHKFESDFYGSKLKYLIVGYLRPEKDFPSLDALVEAIQNDISQSDTWLETAEGKAFLKDALFQ